MIPVRVVATWVGGPTTIYLPDHDAGELSAALQRGELPDLVVRQLSVAGADLIHVEVVPGLKDDTTPGNQ